MDKASIINTSNPILDILISFVKLNAILLDTFITIQSRKVGMARCRDSHSEHDYLNPYG